MVFVFVIVFIYKILKCLSKQMVAPKNRSVKVAPALQFNPT